MSDQENDDRIELTITLRKEQMRASGLGTASYDLAAMATAAAPSARLLSGNAKYSISVSVLRTEAQTMREAIKDDCSVSERVLLQVPDPFAGFWREFEKKPSE